MRTILLTFTVMLFQNPLTFCNYDANAIFLEWQKNYGSINYMEFEFTDRITNVVQQEGRNISPLWDTLTIHTKQSSNGKYSSEYSKTRMNVSGESKTTKEMVVFDGIDQYVFTLSDGECNRVVINDKHLEKGLNLYNELVFYFLTEKVGYPQPPNPPKQINYLELMFPLIVPLDRLIIRAEIEFVSGESCIVVDLLNLPKSKIIQTVWFAKDAGMLPMKYIWYDEKGGFLEKMEVLEVADSNGVWYPKKGRRTQNYRTQYKSITHEINVTKFVANPAFDENDFKVTISPETIVHDSRIKESYLVGSPD